MFLAAAEVVNGDWVLPSWLAFILSFQFIWEGITIGGSILIAWLFKLVISRFKAETAVRDAVAMLEGGVTHTYEEFVRDVKKKAKDGKLSDAERLAARNMAFAEAKKIATGPGKNLLLTWGRPIVESWIEKIVAKRKEKK